MRRLTSRQRIAALTLTVIALLFISLDFSAGSLGGARGGTTGALGSLYRGTDAVLGPVRRFVQAVPDVGSNRHELAQLQSENARLRRQLTDAQLDQSTAAQLKTLQLQANSAGWPMQPARVIATGPGAGFRWTVTVDVGSSAHIQAGQTVTNGLGLVGRVLSVQPNTSTVLLLADASSAIGVRDSRSGALLLARGEGSAGLSAASLAAGADVHVGDQLLSGPAGATTYAANVPVGVVTAVVHRADGSLTATVRPTVQSSSLDLLAIVLVPVPAAAGPAITPVTG